MTRPTRLNDTELNMQMIALPHWTINEERNVIHRRVNCADYASALALVTHLSMIAQRLDHHPDVAFGWGYVVLSSTTHDQKGLTSLDFQLAKMFNKVLDA